MNHKIKEKLRKKVRKNRKSVMVAVVVPLFSDASRLRSKTPT